MAGRQPIAVVGRPWWRHVLIEMTSVSEGSKKLDSDVYII